MNGADYVAHFLATQGIQRIFAISGASDLRLLDAIHRHPEIEYVCPHHEQAGTMAAISHYRITGQTGVMLVTAGAGATNAVTGVANAYLDSYPLVILAGQEKSEFMHPENKLRGKGIQGLPMADVMAPITNYSVCIRDINELRYHIERGFYEAHAGRPGPVWIEIPQDLQYMTIEPDKMKGFTPPEKTADQSFKEAAESLYELVRAAKRPLLWVGNGVRLAGAVEDFKKTLDLLGVPSLVAWNGADILTDDHPLFAGRAGVYGQRGANFAVQNCDLIVGLGTRFATPQIGYSQEEFARAAKKVVVEIDPAEIAKWKKKPDLVVQGDVGKFLRAVNEVFASKERDWNFSEWIQRCADWRKNYPACLPEYKDLPKGKVNSYYFIDRLSDHLAPNETIVADVGTALTCTHAAIRLRKGQRIITTTGLGEMGFGLPGAIGACFGIGRKKMVFIGTEGSLQMNLQELQTVVHYKLPIKFFILNNNGYLTIKHSERALFGDRLSGCSPETGVSFPDLEKISTAYGLPYVKIEDSTKVDEMIQACLEANGPVFCDVMMPEDQPLVPKSAVKVRADGSLYSPPLEDLFPFLPKEEIQKNMLIPMLPE